MWFSDETSFSFVDMTGALSTMASSGGEISTLIPLIEGVANSVAFAGKGAAEFSRTMYNINQSYSMGYLNRMDFKSLEQATVASKQLKQALIDAGVASGKLKKGEVTLDNFAESLQKQWANREVMEKGFGKFSEFTEAVYKAVQDGTYDTASEAIKEMADEYERIGVDAFKAAQTAKTFTEAIAATKDAVSSGWMTTLEHVIGNITEATELWTEVTRVLWEVFAGGAEARNDMFKSWAELGGRKQFLLGIQNIYNSVAMVVYSINKAFRQIFPKNDVDSLLGKTESFRRVTYAIFTWINGVVGDAPRYEHISKIFAGIFSVFNVGFTILKAVGSVIGDVFKMFVPGASDGFLVFFSGIGDSLVEFSKKFDKVTVINKLRNWLADLLIFLSPALLWLGSMGKKFKQAITDFFVGDGLEGEAHNKPGWQVLLEKLQVWYAQAKAFIAKN